MQIIPLADIHVPEYRQRTEFDERELLELAESITSYGLFHPIILRSDGKTLVAGERRFRALTLLAERGTEYKHNGEPIAPGFAPFNTLDNLTPLQLEEVEYEENIRRTDLTWQERVQAEARLHDLRIRQHGEWSKDNPTGWSARATASEVSRKPAVGGAVSATVERIALAKHLDNPLVMGAKSEAEAKRVARKIEQGQKLKQMEDKTREIPKEYNLILGDSREILPTLPSASFDIILMDPPYGKKIDKQHFDSGTQHTYNDDPMYAFDLMRSMFTEISRLAKADAHMYVFHEIQYTDDIRLMLYGEGWEVWRYPIIWDKGNVGSFGASDIAPRHCYEAILFAYRGEKLRVLHKKDVIHVEGLREKSHAAEKPVALLEDLLSRSAYPGEAILDPTCGSGSVFLAAEKFLCRVTGIEIDPDTHAIAKARLLSLSKGD